MNPNPTPNPNTLIQYSGRYKRFSRRIRFPGYFITCYFLFLFYLQFLSIYVPFLSFFLSFLFIHLQLYFLFDYSVLIFTYVLKYVSSSHYFYFPLFASSLFPTILLTPLSFYFCLTTVFSRFLPYSSSSSFSSFHSTPTIPLLSNFHTHRM